MKQSSYSQDAVGQFAKIEPAEVIKYENKAAERNEIIFVLCRLELLKGINTEKEQKAAITQELLRHKITRIHLLDRYEALLSEPFFNRMSIDNFLGREVTDRVRIFREAKRIIDYSIDKFQQEMTDEEIQQLRVDTMCRMRDEFLAKRYRMINEFENEFLNAVNVSWEKVGMASEKIESKLQDLINEIRRRTKA